MQILQTPYNVEDEVKKDKLLEIVSDKYCRSILNAIMDKPKAAVELTRECQIPISTIYRRIQMLHDAKMLQISGQISGEGKKFFLYKSRVKEIQAHYNNGDVQIELVFNQ